MACVWVSDFGSIRSAKLDLHVDGAPSGVVHRPCQFARLDSGLAIVTAVAINPWWYPSVVFACGRETYVRAAQSNSAEQGALERSVGCSALVAILHFFWRSGQLIASSDFYATYASPRFAFGEVQADMAADRYLVPINPIVSEVVMVLEFLPDVVLLSACLFNVGVREVGQVIIIVGVRWGRFFDDLHIGSARRASHWRYVRP